MIFCGSLPPVILFISPPVFLPAPLIFLSPLLFVSPTSLLISTPGLLKNRNIFYRTRRKTVIGIEPSGRGGTFQESSSPVCLRLAGAFAKFQTAPLHRRHTLMPRGVEYSYRSQTQTRPRQVIFPLMPRGVEHRPPSTFLSVLSGVIFQLLPRGVEHVYSVFAVKLPAK
jgi:hypothetical protein